MATRVLVGSILIAALCGVFWLDWWLEQGVRWHVVGLPMAVVLLVLILIAMIEMFVLCAIVKVLILLFSGLLGAALLGSLPFWWQFLSPIPPSGEHVLLILAVIMLVVFADQMMRSRTADAIRAIACTFLAVLYLGVGGAMMLGIRVRSGVPVFVLFLGAVKFTDIGAYFVGSRIGRHKMVPWLSPHKSWEGLVGGLAAAAGISMLLTAVLRLPLTLPNAAVFGAVVGLFGQFADLCESLLKRSANVKDSGWIVLGSGGVLDLLDSPLLAAPVGYMMLGILR